MATRINADPDYMPRTQVSTDKIESSKVQKYFPESDD